MRRLAGPGSPAAGRCPRRRSGAGIGNERAEALAQVERVARDVFGYPRLRPGQAEAMASLVVGHDVLLVMPTGSGKSAVYQVPAVLLHGATVVISPLIALQRDQVTALREHGDQTMAYAVSSAVSASEQERAWQAVASGAAEFLFLAPEQLANPEVLERVRALRPSVIAVDEAHAVSAWGHDFRPDYLRLGDFIDAVGHPRVVALTATAAPGVREDIVERLHLRNPEIIVKGFARPNIAMEVVRSQTETEKRQAVVQRAAAEVKPAVVYTATRREAEEYRDAVAELGLGSAAYHGGMRTADRDEVQRAFMDDEIDVIVATSAFGMGIDKPGIRTVIHAAVPESLDTYYQEIGRAGRDGLPCVAVLYYRPEDLGLRRFFASSIPKDDDVEAVARALGGTAPAEVDRRALARSTGMGPRKVGRIVNLLDEVDARDRRHPREAADRAVEVAESQRTLEQTRVEMTRGFCETRRCRRQFLLAYFGEELADPCGNCDTCRRGSAQEVGEVSDVPYPLQSRVRHGRFGEGVVMGYEGDPDRVTVLFEESGYRTLALDAVRRHGLLTPAG
ncbi:MAG TPA: RecQ family ATP-dependent DNA helicase [Kineosporiaceae bacterium]